MMAWRSGETLVAGEEWSVEHFGEGDVHGVIGREIVPQIPHARQEKIVRISAQREVSEVLQGRAAALGIDITVSSVPPNHLRDFDVEQMGRMQCLRRLEQPLLYCACGGRAKERFQQGRSIDDNHWRSRSARTAWAGDTEGVTPGRRSRRARNSSSVGRSAT